MPDDIYIAEPENIAEPEITAEPENIAEPDSAAAGNEPGAEAAEAPGARARERFFMAPARWDYEKTVGEPQELIPFAWRYPLQTTGQKKVSKVLKNMAAAESERAELVPAGNPVDR